MRVPFLVVALTVPPERSPSTLPVVAVPLALTPLAVLLASPLPVSTLPLARPAATVELALASAERPPGPLALACVAAVQLSIASA